MHENPLVLLNMSFLAQRTSSIQNFKNKTFDIDTFQNRKKQTETCKISVVVKRKGPSKHLIAFFILLKRINEFE